MRAGPVTAGDKQRARVRDGVQRRGQVRRALGGCRIGGRANDHEIIVHHIISGIGIALGDEFFLQRLAVHQQHIAIAVHGVLHGGAGSDRDNAHPQIGFLLEGRKKVLEQPGILGRGCRLDDESLLAGKSHG